MSHRTFILRTLRRVLGLAVAALFLCGPLARPLAAHSQNSDAPPWLVSMFAWLAAVNTHQPGHRDGAVGTTMTEGLQQLEDVLSDVLALADVLSARERAREAAGGSAAELLASQKPIEYHGRRFPPADLRRFFGIADDEPVRVGLNRLLRRASVYHTDVALVGARNDTDPAAARLPGRSVYVVGDGQQVRNTTSSVHWEFGRELLDRLQPGPARDPFARAWYRATSSALQWLRMLTEADDHLSRARQIFSDDARLLFEGGCALETLAAPTVRAALGPDALLQRSSGSLRVVAQHPSVRSLLDRAEQLFRRALQHDPTLAEARVRLARLTAQHGQHAEAIDLLNGALAANPPDDVRYLALMALGDEEQAIGRRADARSRYEAAAALFPTAQSPLLALGLLAREGGDRAAAIAALERLAKLPPDPALRVDPAWAYSFMQGRDADRLMQQLYALLAKETL